MINGILSIQASSIHVICGLTKATEGLHILQFEKNITTSYVQHQSAKIKYLCATETANCLSLSLVDCAADGCETT
jgi:hypothetical protein